MNHGPQFWEFLDRLYGTDSKTVRQQLKAFKTTI
jgi:predicted metal-dependent hydrolase